MMKNILFLLVVSTTMFSPCLNLSDDTFSNTSISVSPTIDCLYDPESNLTTTIDFYRPNMTIYLNETTDSFTDTERNLTTTINLTAIDNFYQNIYIRNDRVGIQYNQTAFNNVTNTTYWVSAPGNTVIVLREINISSFNTTYSAEPFNTTCSAEPIPQNYCYQNTNINLSPTSSFYYNSNTNETVRATFARDFTWEVYPGEFRYDDTTNITCRIANSENVTRNQVHQLNLGDIILDNASSNSYIAPSIEQCPWRRTNTLITLNGGDNNYTETNTNTTFQCLQKTFDTSILYGSPCTARAEICIDYFNDFCYSSDMENPNGLRQCVERLANPVVFEQRLNETRLEVLSCQRETEFERANSTACWIALDTTGENIDGTIIIILLAILLVLGGVLSHLAVELYNRYIRRIPTKTSPPIVGGQKTLTPEQLVHLRRPIKQKEINNYILPEGYNEV